MIHVWSQLNKNQTPTLIEVTERWHIPGEGIIISFMDIAQNPDYSGMRPCLLVLPSRMEKDRRYVMF